MLDCAKSCEFMENIVIFSEDAKCVTPTQRLLRKVAILLSVAFHPMMMPIYAMMYILYGNQLWSALPAAYKTTMILYICIPTSVVPLAMLALMVMFGFVGDPEMPNKSERILPITVSTTLIAIACFVMHNVIELPLPMIQLASQLSISRASLYRALDALLESGVISKQGREYKIEKPAKLREYVNI